MHILLTYSNRSVGGGCVSYEEIKQLSDKYQSYHYPTMQDSLGDHTFDGNTLIDYVPMLLKALELCHKEWQEEYQNVCYEGGYSSLIPENEQLTPDYWLEKARQEMGEVV
jgi:hypothetical protein